MYRKYFKRLIDILASGSALVVLSVPLGLITLWLHFANKGAGAFFHQERPGKGGKIFRVHKFKSMTDERDANGNLLPDKDRLTKVGKFVRSTSIDELPQIWNVFVGDMSLIGPRPLLTKYLAWYTDRENYRHNVKPGITGLAQVNGRNHCKWEERLEMDAYYAKNINFMLDMKILYKTIKNLFSSKDIEVAPNRIDFDEYRRSLLNHYGMTLQEYSLIPFEKKKEMALNQIMK